MTDHETPMRPKVVYATTVGMSAQSLLRGQLAWFVKQGWSVTLVTTPDAAALKTVQREGVRLEGIPMKRQISLGYDLLALIRWIRLLRRIRPQAVNVGTPKAGLLGILAAWVVRVPRRVYMVRGLRLEGATGILKIILWAMERLTTAAATDVIVVSQSLAQELNRLGLAPSKKTWLIGSGSSNGVDTTAIMERASEVDRDLLRAQTGFNSSDFVVGFVGRVTGDKGVETLVRAFHSPEMHPRSRLLIIGPIEDPQLEKQISGLGSRARLVPWTDDVWGYLPALDVLCLPTLREGFPTVVLEAAAAGIPTITTRATGAIDSVLHEETGFLIEPGDSSALTSHVNQFVANPMMVERFGVAAQTRARAEFASEQVWSGIAEVLSGGTNQQYAHRLDE